MRKLPALVLLGMLPTLVAAAVYKWVDADGTAHFSDVPQEGAEEVHIAPPQTYQAPSLQPITPRPEVVANPAAYTRFALVTPAAEENIWDNTGTLAVTFAVEPPLRADRGHQLVLVVDGEARPPVPDSGVVLENVERGSHTLQGQIVDAVGNILMSSEPITVYVHRQSVLAPKAAQPKSK